MPFWIKQGDLVLFDWLGYATNNPITWFIFFINGQQKFSINLAVFMILCKHTVLFYNGKWCIWSPSQKKIPVTAAGMKITSKIIGLKKIKKILLKLCQILSQKMDNFGYFYLCPKMQNLPPRIYNRFPCWTIYNITFLHLASRFSFSCERLPAEFVPWIG